MRILRRSSSRRCWPAAALLGVVGLSATLTEAYDLDVDSKDSIKSISRQIADDMIDNFYFGHKPGNEPGILPSPYYWWEAGALMGTLIDYWYYTGDTKFNEMTTAGLLAQVGEEKDYMPLAQVKNEGNDDQGFWGMSVMAAAEYKFPDPPADQPQWLALAQAVFNTQASRWETQHCNGGLRWQIFQWNNGYDYKNTISQGCFFNIAARLALYTGNHSYAEWAERSYDWTHAVGFIDDDWNVFDGGSIQSNCTSIVPYQWTYNHGSIMHGVTAMYNYTTGAEREKWRYRLEGLLNRSAVFFEGPNNDIMYEVPCEPVRLCNIDQQSFKAYLSRWMASMTKWAPWTYDFIMPRLRGSAKAATSQCNAGANGRMCGHRWTDNGVNDGLLGLGQQMAALEVTLGLLVEHSTGPVTENTGGTSVGDPSAGGRDMGITSPQEILAKMPPLSTSDRAGAYILTIAAILGLITGITFVLVDEADGKTWPQRWSDLHRYIVGGGTALVATGGVLRKSQQFEKGKDVAGPLSDSDGSVREKRASSRIILDPPNLGAGASVPPTPPPKDGQQTLVTAVAGLPQPPKRAGSTLHRKSRSAPLWDPELGIAEASSPGAGAGFRRSASQQMKRNSLKKRSPSEPVNVI